MLQIKKPNRSPMAGYYIVQKYLDGTIGHCKLVLNQNYLPCEEDCLTIKGKEWRVEGRIYVSNRGRGYCRAILVREVPDVTYDQVDEIDIHEDL